MAEEAIARHGKKQTETKKENGLDSLEATQWAPRDTYRDPGVYQNPLLPLDPRPDSLGESGMRPRDPYRPWRGTLGPGHKPR